MSNLTQNCVENVKFDILHSKSGENASYSSLYPGWLRLSNWQKSSTATSLRRSVPKVPFLGKVLLVPAIEPPIDPRLSNDKGFCQKEKEISLDKYSQRKWSSSGGKNVERKLVSQHRAICNITHTRAHSHAHSTQSLLTSMTRNIRMNLTIRQTGMQVPGPLQMTWRKQENQKGFKIFAWESNIFKCVHA